ncbi:urease accessory protein UreE [Marinobacter sediminum]|uniref:urease accessory protein UreE n=1 Tax=Marinobacter sediminum TaxID=256323 RepID=UPI00202F0287|nr:urease accessory protein UreE [Marinobacter sediminum]MCM0613048.1 urease accessory protein UreE [Marinobacter sediminum]
MLELTQRVGPVDTSEIHDHLTLPFELRMRGRLRAKTDTGYDVGLFLDRGPVLREGAFLQAETGEIIRIRAADEPVVTAHIEPGLAMARLCYHLGNRHVSLAIGSDDKAKGGPVDGKTAWVRFPPDHVLEELAEHLGATLEHHRAPFDPEPGAYAQTGHSHGKGHHHDHPHAH